MPFREVSSIRSTSFSFVTIQASDGQASDGQTGGQTDRQNCDSNTVRCITCSRTVKCDDDCMVDVVDVGGHVTELNGEYCERDVFNADCSAPDELLLITAALYGRMRQGKCVSTRPIGCKVDVHKLLAARCSARQRCRVNVASLVPDHKQPCHADYRSYLQASYTCIKGNLFTCHGRHVYNNDAVLSESIV